MLTHARRGVVALLPSPRWSTIARGSEYGGRGRADDPWPLLSSGDEGGTIAAEEIDALPHPPAH